MKLKKPKYWTIINGERTWKPPYGMCNRSLKKIILYLPIWLPKKISKEPILNHEYGHAYGIDGCKNPLCLMFESSKFSELLAKPFLFFRHFKFCKKCKEFLNDQGAFDN